LRREAFDMAVQFAWWVVAVALGVAELFTGSFYMIVLAAGAASAGFAAALGYGTAAQFTCAAVVSAAGAVLVRRLRARAEAAHRNPDVNLDIGQAVDVTNWDAQGRARVSYRGAMWDVELMPGERPTPGRFRIREVDGSRLRLARADGTADARS
jgi:membrane protein implicated in regulation of membrane protease activity